jgi:hypothetical protein
MTFQRDAIHSYTTNNREGEAEFLRRLRDILSPPAGREPYRPTSKEEMSALNEIGSRLMELSRSTGPVVPAVPTDKVLEAIGPHLRDWFGRPCDYQRAAKVYSAILLAAANEEAK